MRSANRDSYGRNEMITPITFASVFDNGGDGESLFTINETGDAIVPVQEIPVRNSSFQITASNDEIASDDRNAVNVACLKAFMENIDDNVLVNYMDQEECDARYVQLSTYNPDMNAVKTNVNTLETNLNVLQQQTENSVNALNQIIDEDEEMLSQKLTEVDNAIASKANMSDVYTKAETYTQNEIDELVDGVQATVDADLSNYYTKDVLYTKSETYSREQTINEIDKITYVQNDGAEIVGYREWDELKPVIDENGNPVVDENGDQVYETIHHKEPVYSSDTVSHDFWDTKSGAKICEIAMNQALSLPGKIFNRIFIEPKKRRIKTACLAAVGALVGTKTITQEICWGITAANSCTKGGDDDPGDIDFEDDYHGNRTLTNMVHDSEYDSMKYVDEDNKEHALTPDSTVPTTQAIKNHHYTKAETDAIIDDYYTKDEVDALITNNGTQAKTLVKDDNVTKTYLSNQSLTFQSGGTYEVSLGDLIMNSDTINFTATASINTHYLPWSDLNPYLVVGAKSMPLDFKRLGIDETVFECHDSLNFDFGSSMPVQFKIRYAADDSADGTAFTINNFKINYSSITSIQHYYTKNECYGKDETYSKSEVNDLINVVEDDIAGLSNAIEGIIYWDDFYYRVTESVTRTISSTPNSIMLFQTFWPTRGKAVYKFELTARMCWYYPDASVVPSIDNSNLSMRLAVNDQAKNDESIFTTPLTIGPYYTASVHGQSNQLCFDVTASGEFICTPSDTNEYQLSLCFENICYANPVEGTEYTLMLNDYVDDNNNTHYWSNWNGQVASSDYFYFKSEVDAKLKNLEARIAALESK